MCYHAHNVLLQSNVIQVKGNVLASALSLKASTVSTASEQAVSCELCLLFVNVL